MPADPNIIILKNVRLSFPNLFKPRASQDNPDAAPKYSASFLLDKESQADQIKLVQKAIDRIKAEQWKGKTPILKGICLRDGAEKADMSGYGDDIMFVSASTTNKPKVASVDMEPLSAEDGKPYGGCIVHASIRLWAQDNKFGKRVNAELRAVIFVKDGEAFGAAPVSLEEDFAGLDLSEDDHKPAKPTKGKAKPAVEDEDEEL